MHSQRIYAIHSGIDHMAFVIHSGIEYFLYMDMCVESQWASYKFNNWTWVKVTQEYNNTLENKNKKLRLSTVQKHPRIGMF